MKYLVDANVMICGIFSPNSFSRKVLERIVRKNLEGFIIQNTLEEVYGAIKRAHTSTLIDLSDEFRRTFTQLGITVLPRVSDRDISSVEHIKGKGDKAIYFAASKYGLKICTNDIGDFQRHEESVEVLSPHKLNESFKGLPDLSTVTHGAFVSEWSGSFYMEFQPGGWNGRDFDSLGGMEFTLFDLPRIAKLYIDTNSSEIRCNVADFEITIPRNKIEGVSKIAVTYDCDQGFGLYFGHHSSKERVAKTWVPTGIYKSKISIGSDHQGNNSLYGLISVFSGLPGMLSETAINKLMSGKVIPSHTDRMGLESLIKEYYL